MVQRVTLGSWFLGGARAAPVPVWPGAAVFPTLARSCPHLRHSLTSRFLPGHQPAPHSASFIWILLSAGQGGYVGGVLSLTCDPWLAPAGPQQVLGVVQGPLEGVPRLRQSVG